MLFITFPFKVLLGATLPIGAPEVVVPLHKVGVLPEAVVSAHELVQGPLAPSVGDPPNFSHLLESPGPRFRHALPFSKGGGCRASR